MVARLFRFGAGTFGAALLICAGLYWSAGLVAAKAPKTITNTTAQDPAGQNPVDKVIERARGECRGFENGMLTVAEGTVTRVDVTGNGQADTVIDARFFRCSSAASLFCGTGGCAISVIADGSTTEFLAKGWRLIPWAPRRILLLEVHGSRCGGTNLRSCFQALSWSEGAFRSLSDR